MSYHDHGFRKGPYPTRGVTRAFESFKSYAAPAAGAAPANAPAAEPIRVEEAAFMPQWATPDFPSVRFALVALSSAMHPHEYLRVNAHLASFQVRMHVANSISARLEASKTDASGRVLHTASCMTKKSAVNIQYVDEHVLESSLEKLESMGDRRIGRPDQNEYIIVAFEGDGWYTCVGCSMFKVANERLLRDGRMVSAPVVRCVVRTASSALRGLGARLQALLEEVARNVGADLIRMESVDTKYATRPAACVVYSDNPNAQAPGLRPITTLNDAYQRIGFMNLHDACAARIHDATPVNPYATSAVSMSKCLRQGAPAGPHLGPMLPNHPWALLDTLDWFYDMRMSVEFDACTLELTPREGVNAPMRLVKLTGRWPVLERYPAGEGVAWDMQLEWVRISGEHHVCPPSHKDIGKAAVFSIEVHATHAFPLQALLIKWVRRLNNGEHTGLRRKEVYAHMLRYLLHAMRWHHAPVPDTKPRTIIEPVAP